MVKSSPLPLFLMWAKASLRLRSTVEFGSHSHDLPHPSQRTSLGTMLILEPISTEANLERSNRVNRHDGVTQRQELERAVQDLGDPIRTLVYTLCQHRGKEWLVFSTLLFDDDPEDDWLRVSHSITISDCWTNVKSPYHSVRALVINLLALPWLPTSCISHALGVFHILSSKW